MADRVERLTNLLALLLETAEPLTLVEIAAELGGMYPEATSARRGAFERDKAALREIGVPIESEIVEGGPWAGTTRYWIDRDRYELRGLDLTEEETRALQVAVAAIRSGSGSAGSLDDPRGAAQLGLWKVGGTVVDAVPPVAAALPSSPLLPSLRDAVARRAVVGFRYRDVDREVEPWGLLLREGFWYLVGHDRTRGERRTFRVDRIDGEVSVGAPGAFERPQVDPRRLVPTDVDLLTDRTSPEAVVRIGPARAEMVVAEVGPDRVVGEHDDGSVDVTVGWANTEAFRSWVLGLMEHAEVVAPPEARAMVRDWLHMTAVGAGADDLDDDDGDDDDGDGDDGDGDGRGAAGGGRS